jgi:hypothetical protein
LLSRFCIAVMHELQCPSMFSFPDSRTCADYGSGSIFLTKFIGPEL